MSKPVPNKYDSRHSLNRLLPVAIVGCGSSLDAGIIAITNPNPVPNIVFQAANTPINWDIDLDGTDDFLFSIDTGIVSGTFYMRRGPDQAVSAGVVSSSFIYRLIPFQTTVPTFQTTPPLTVVSPGLTYQWGARDPVRVMNSTYLLDNVNVFFNLTNTSLTETLNVYAGFRFSNDQDELLYGWARFSFDPGGGSGATFSIHEWAYNDTPNQGIKVGAIPEPAHVVSGLGLLAAGAAGLRRMRRRRQSAD